MQYPTAYHHCLHRTSSRFGNIYVLWSNSRRYSLFPNAWNVKNYGQNWIQQWKRTQAPLSGACVRFNWCRLHSRCLNVSYRDVSAEVSLVQLKARLLHSVFWIVLQCNSGWCTSVCIWPPALCIQDENRERTYPKSSPHWPTQTQSHEQVTLVYVDRRIPDRCKPCCRNNSHVFMLRAQQ